MAAYSCAKRAADPSNEFAACRQHCGNDDTCLREPEPLTTCAWSSGQPGCVAGCPQIVDGEPAKSGRGCPLPRPGDAAEALTVARILEIRDALLPPQGEPFDCVAFAVEIVKAERARMIADGWRRTKYVAPVTDCEACLTPDACAIRGQCAHYLRERG